jgi:hypothetical protein
VGKAGPIRHRGIDTVEVRNVNLPVLGDHGARHIRAANTDCRQRHRRSNAKGAGPKTVRLSPLCALDELDRDAGSAKQTRTGLCDLLQRPPGVARGACDGAQDFGAGGLAVSHGAQLSLQPGILLPEIRHHVRGKRGHSKSPFARGWGAAL